MTANDLPCAPRAVPARLPASKASRIGVVIAIGVVLALFAIAAKLQPSPLGYGTHQQLGLPPCSSVALVGVRCPACGMTTAWSYAFRGQWVDAWHANAGGLTLVVIALVYIPTLCYYVARGHWSRHGWLSFSLALSLSAALLVAAGQWLTRLIWLDA
jgi:hypothetical protein